jgi:hypothetical protein
MTAGVVRVTNLTPGSGVATLRHACVATQLCTGVYWNEPNGVFKMLGGAVTSVGLQGGGGGGGGGGDSLHVALPLSLSRGGGGGGGHSVFCSSLTLPLVEVI